MPGDNRLVTENFLRLNFTPKSGITPGTNDLISMSCDQILARYTVVISGLTTTGVRLPSQNQILFGSAAIYDNYANNTCGTGYHGTDFLVDFAYGHRTSYTSQLDADQQAVTAAQEYANTWGGCEPDAACSINTESALSCSTTSVSLTVDCDGSYSVSFTYVGGEPCIGSAPQLTIYDGSHSYITAESVSGSWSGNTYTGSGTISTSLADGYYVSIDLYI